MIRKLTIIFMCVLVQIYFINAQDFKTLTYFKSDSLNLEMDVFMPKGEVNEKTSLYIFVHGGGFSSGNRTLGHYLCKYLAGEGMVAASISYTLYMKGKDFGCDGILSEKVKAIQYGVSQLWQATGYFIEHAEEYSIDTSKIFIAGSSAGGETVLHAAFWDRELMNMYDKKLPDDFKYAGVISRAGALMDINLIQPDNVIPVFMFHGSCDKLVPYATASHHYCETNTPGWLMFFGSYTIYNCIIELGGATKLITFCGAGHKKVGSIAYELKEVDLFINAVNNGEKFQTHIIIPTDKSCEASEQYNFCH